MRLIFAALAALWLIGMPSDGISQSPHPLAPQGALSDAPTSKAEPGLWSQFIGYVYRMQRDLHRQLAGAVRAVQGEKAGEAALTLAVLSFLYGIFHAAGPGHGKAVISAYVLANGSVVRRGVFLSFASALAQAVTAIALVGVISLGLSMVAITTREATAYLERASFALIVLLGVWLLWRTLRSIRQNACGHDHAHGQAHDHAHDHDQDGRHGCGHDHGLAHATVAGPSSLKSTLGLIVAVGIRPCTGAVLVLMFAQALGIFYAGVWATLAMSVGTALTVSVLAVLTILSRDLAERLVRVKAGWVTTLQTTLGVLASGALIFLGLSLFWGPGVSQSPL